MKINLVQTELRKCENQFKKNKNDIKKRLVQYHAVHFEMYIIQDTFNTQNVGKRAHLQNK